MKQLPAHMAKPRSVPHNHLMFGSALSPVGTPVSLDWRQFNYVMQMAGHEKVANKTHAKLLTPWTPIDGALTRKADAFAHTAMLVFDLDKIDTADIDEVISWCGNFAALVHTTYSHGVDGLGCYRVYMTLDRTVSANEYKLLHAALLATLPELARRVDPTCQQPERCYFMPSCPTERHHLAETRPSLEGRAIEVAKYLYQPTQPTAKPSVTAIPAPTHPPVATSNTIAALMPEPVAQGQRNQALASLAGRVYAKGYTPEALQPEAERWGQRCTPPLDSGEVLATIQSMWKTHTRNNPQERGWQPVTAAPSQPPIADEQASQTRPKRLLTAHDLQALPPMKWRVRGLLPAYGLASIYGPSGSAKTFLALDLAGAIGSGAPQWFGSNVNAAPVAYVALEGEGGIRQRVAAWEAQCRKPMPPSVRFVLGNFGLLHASDSEELATEIIQAIGPGAVVVVDTLNQSAPGADENASSDMSRVIYNTKLLATAVEGVVILVHHSGKDASRGMRGHSSLFAAMDVVIEVSSTVNGRAWRVAKSKDGVSGVAHGFELVPHVVGQDEDGASVTSCAIRRTLAMADKSTKPVVGKNQKLAFQVLRELARKHLDGIPTGVALQAVGAVLTCDDRRRATRAAETIKGLTESGHLHQSDGLVLPNDC